MLAEPLTDSGTEEWVIVDQQDLDPVWLLLARARAGHVPPTASTFASQPVASAVLAPVHPYDVRVGRSLVGALMVR